MVLRAADQTACRFSAEDLPGFFRSATRSKAIFCPSLRARMPARSTALMCTKTSLPPSSGWIKPKPLWLLKDFVVPYVVYAGLHGDVCKVAEREVGDLHRHVEQQ